MIPLMGLDFEVADGGMGVTHPDIVVLMGILLTKIMGFVSVWVDALGTLPNGYKLASCFHRFIWLLLPDATADVCR